jgi:hypothetical protein
LWRHSFGRGPARQLGGFDAFREGRREGGARGREDAGLILADAYGAEVMREAPEHKLVAASRKAMMLRFARCAALRLQSLADPTGPYQDAC